MTATDPTTQPSTAPCPENPDTRQAEPTPTRGRAATFAVVSAALVLVFVSSGTPIPLYNIYRTEDGIDSAALAITTVTYLSVTALSLLLLGRLSNHLGRKPVAIGALLASAAGCLLLTQVDSLPVLLSGRALQGIACGIAASSIGSYVVDVAPRRPAWLGPLVVTAAPTFGIPLGALVSGILIVHAPAPRTFGYVLIAGILVVVAILLLFAPETVTRTPGALRALRPRVQLPTGTDRLAVIAVVVAVFLATWSYSGMYQAFAPSLTADHLGTSSPIVIALVFSSIVILSPVGGSISGRLTPKAAIRAGLLPFLVAVIVAVAALYAGSIVAFLGASLAASLALGAATTGAMRLLLTGAAPKMRAGLLSSVYLVSYAGAALPGLVAGAFATSVDLTDIAAGYAVLVLVATAIAIIASRRLER
ncbi:MFS transporter [Millisia brevis]|uniref:MFS transporter n=1 Tax=Millisia brevis TaxID=264148 RepID=UPI0008309917|nr:MFS transporter [Millisia brevis]